MNPLLLKAIPYLLAASLGFGGAWKIQALRVTEAKQALQANAQAATAAVLQAEATHQQINQEVSDGWAKNLVALRERFAAGRVLPAAHGAAPAVPEAAAGADAAAAESESAAAGLVAALSREACAADALQVLTLQHWIERVAE